MPSIFARNVITTGVSQRVVPKMLTVVHHKIYLPNLVCLIRMDNKRDKNNTTNENKIGAIR